jgi:L-amino acid N-acyltransferase YncA
VIIREASEHDLPGILAIYNDVIATSTAAYALTPVALEDRRAWLDGRRALGYPVLVADAQSQIAGFASFGDFRAWPGYRYTVEHSVYVAAGRRGGGIGRRLVETLIPIAAGLGKHVMIGGIDADNTPSIAFHRRLGFEQVAHFREVGHKFGRWLDLVFMQRMLDAPGASRQ